MNKRSVFKVVAAGCAVAALTACDGSGPHAGDYALWQVDRRPVPETLAREKLCVVVMVRGNMRIEEENTFRSTYQINRNCAAGPEALPDPGTPGKFTVTGDTILFTTMDGAATGRGTYRGDTITVQGPEHELRFVRRTE